MINTKPKRSHEPVWWLAFGAGGSWFAMITPVTILIFAFIVPFMHPISFESMRAFAEHFLGALIIIASIALPMWHAMHRVHHAIHDFKFHPGLMGQMICYGLATFVTLLAIIFVLMV